MTASPRSSAFARVARRARALRHRLLPAPTRPVAVIQSDDWGRTGAPTAMALQRVRAVGHAVGESPWDHYGLETANDLEALQDVLRSSRDAQGRHASMTAVFVMANADLARMRAESYREFRAIPIIDGFPPDSEQPALIVHYRQLVADGVFCAALHGYTHFNPDLLVALAKEDSPRGQRVRALHDHGIPYLASLTPEFNFALLDRSAAEERFIPRDAQRRWIGDGVQLFQRAFGRAPASTCAPGYRFNEDSLALWRDAGVGVVHVAGGSMELDAGLWVLPRNVHFEPVLAPDALARALAQAERAVARGEAIVISTHSINYVDRHLGRAAHGRSALSQLLRALVEKFPQLRFAREDELYESWRHRSPDWWRRPTIGEIARRDGS